MRIEPSFRKQDPTYLEYIPRFSVMDCLIKKEKAFSIWGLNTFSFSLQAFRLQYYTMPQMYGLFGYLQTFLKLIHNKIHLIHLAGKIPHRTTLFNAFCGIWGVRTQGFVIDEVAEL